MSQRIPDEKIEQVRQSLDIVDIVSEYVQLKKQGRNFQGLCPFHGEKTPSFSVSPDKQLYHCFGCGAGGNAFSFVMEIEDVSFIEAVEKLANKTDVTIPELDALSKTEESSDNKSKSWHEAHQLAAKLYHHVLTVSDEGKQAREYLRGRGFTKEVIDHFQIGYAPNSWEFLSRFLLKRDFSMEEMEQAGLVGLRDSDSKAYDKFRDRIMFPIWDRQGKMVAFGGRVLNDGKPKYLNSPESQLFNKSDILYYFHQARPLMKKKSEAVLFEGYVDVISAWRAGIDNGIGGLGTALTENQAKMLRRNIDRIIICYDSDHAGMQATYKNGQLLRNVGLEVEVALLPDGDDPDDYIRKHGSKRFNQDVILQSVTFMSFIFEFYRKGKNLQQEGDRLTYIENILQEISQLSGAVERDHYLRKLADEFSLSLEALKQEQMGLMKVAEKKQKRQIHKAVQTRVAKEPKKLLPAHENAERELIALMLHSRSIADHVQKEIGGNFYIDDYQAIAALIYSYYGEGYDPNPSHFIERISDSDLRSKATSLAMKRVNHDLSEQELNDYLKQIHQFPKYREIDQLKIQQKKAEEMNNFGEAALIAMQIIKMKQELKNH
ncbi:DNA primase [Salipaludibacillus neizhouensis]|uniref:DNA primase n=1 Tax=Salipaludibacillus neizhouensis TaxID=885475 RepID=A0A3A9K833_9BACI|nr:DNA primase [Salipaludibacillus neizhouensis]RKL68687.1 DNA primase [Salipaludibacillus neizhouensis]